MLDFVFRRQCGYRHRCDGGADHRRRHNRDVHHLRPLGLLSFADRPRPAGRISPLCAQADGGPDFPAGERHHHLGAPRWDVIGRPAAIAVIMESATFSLSATLLQRASFRWMRSPPRRSRSGTSYRRGDRRRHASEAKQSRAAFAALRASLDHAIAFAGVLSPWQNLNFLPLPQGQGA